MYGKKIKNAAIYVVSAILSVLLICYILYHLLSGLNKELETTPAILATQNSSLVMEAYVVRDETLITASVEGGVNYLFRDGEKVSAGTVVANVYSGAGASEVSDRILEIDKKIEVLENSNLSENATITDTTVIDDKIYTLFYVMRDKVQDGDLEYALHKKDELLTYLNKRLVITQTEKGYEQQIIALQEEKGNLIGQLINLAEQIKVAKSGYFYSMVDGYESVFGVKAFDDLDHNKFRNMVNSTPFDYSSSMTVGKIVNTNEWYIVSEVSKDLLNKFTEGDNYDVIFPYNSDISVNMLLQKIVRDNGEDTVLLVFKTDNMPEGFEYLRKQDIKISEKSYTGYRVPVNSVRVVNGKQGVYVLSGNTVKFKEISILLEHDGYYLVKEQPTYLDDELYYEKLALYDMIIVSGKNLYDGKIISKSGGK